MPPQHIPHELESLILSHIRNDSNALKETALTCYRFALVSQKLLFTSILFDLTLGRGPDDHRRFLAAAPHIANSIRGIDVVVDSFRVHALDTVLLPCLSLLGNLRHISIDTSSSRPIYWRYLSPVLCTSLRNIAHSNRLVTLRLRRIFEVPLSLLAECSSLQALSLCSITFKQADIQCILDGRWTLSPSLKSPQLRTLQLSVSDDVFRTLLKFLTGSNILLDISGLAEFSISIFSPRFDYANVNSLLQAVGSSLEIFCFSPMVTAFPGIHARGEQFSSLCLNLLPRMRVFRLRLVAERAHKSNTTYGLFEDCACSILNRLRPDHGRLEEISIKTAMISQILKGGEYREDAPSWGTVDATLNQISSLQRLTIFIVQGGFLQPEVVSHIQDAFPYICKSKAILRIREATSTLGFLKDVNDSDLLGEVFRRHNMA